MDLLITIVLIAAIGLLCGLAIYIVYISVPHKVPGLKKIDEINKLLPGMNCGACGYAGCFAFAQQVVNNPQLAASASCPVLLGDSHVVKQLEVALGVTIDADAMSKKAMVRCTGASEQVFEYTGIPSCKAAILIARGFKRCPFACLGMGDCERVCKYDAITIDPEKRTAHIDYVKCTGCGLCAKECPQKLIEMVPGRTTIAFRCNYPELKNIPGRERCENACIHCRKCFKACRYEAISWKKEQAVPEFHPEKCTLCGECIEVCPNRTLEFFKPGFGK